MEDLPMDPSVSDACLPLSLVFLHGSMGKRPRRHPAIIIRIPCRSRIDSVWSTLHVAAHPFYAGL